MDRTTHLAGLDNGNGLNGLIASALRHILHGVDNVHSLDNITEDDLNVSRSQTMQHHTHVLAIEPRSLDGTDKKLESAELRPFEQKVYLRAVGVTSGVGHGYDLA